MRRTLTQEHKDKISKANKGKSRPYSVKNLSGFFGVYGSDNPFYGKRHTEETKEIIRAKRKGQFISKESYVKAAAARSDFYLERAVYNICRICGKKYRIKKSRVKISSYCSSECRKMGVSLQFKGIPKNNEHKKKIGMKSLGRPCANPHGRGNSGFREDLGQFFRSNWEANCARIMNYEGIDWQYELKRIVLSECTFLIDFYCPDIGLFIEVKGYCPDGVDKKITALLREKPFLNFLVIDKRLYKELENKYKNKITKWEG